MISNGFKTAVELTRLHLSFDGQPVLKNLSLSVCHGDKVTLTGPSGSGKSTVLRCILGLVVPDSGTITILGETVTRHNIWQKRRHIAYVAQEPDLGDGSVKEVIETPFTFRANAGLRDNLARLPAIMARFNLPEPLLDKQITRLSGGEKQRVALTIAILLDRPIVLLDEASSALDTKNKQAVAVLRMTVQLLFVGLYLQVVFKLNNPFLNLAWVAAMILVADLSILKGCRLKLKRFLLPMFTSLVVGTVLPMIFFAGIILRLPGWFEAQYVIPLAGMILGNCLRADIIGLNNFYQSIHKNEKTYHQSLAYGAALTEAVAPFFREALRSALAPTIASMATIGLVSLPGMMTGVMLAGADPFTAIKYQIAIMIAIFSGTAITVFLAIRLTVANSFNAYGILHPDILRNH